MVKDDKNEFDNFKEYSKVKLKEIMED